MSLIVEHLYPSALSDSEWKFWERVVPEPMSGCWLWLGEIDEAGYARLYTRTPKITPAHRFSYRLLVGEIADEMTLDHLCRTRCCVNPAHLEPVSAGENVLRGEGLSAKNKRKTHCSKGHPFSEENTRWLRNGKKRQCRTCEKEWEKTSKSRRAS